MNRLCHILRSRCISMLSVEFQKRPHLRLGAEGALSETSGTAGAGGHVEHSRLACGPTKNDVLVHVYRDR